jgi:flagellar hook assembly protein FlgD
MAKASTEEAIVPATPSLVQNSPNPFNPTTQIRFTLPVSGDVKMSVFNLLGQQVRTLVDGFKEAGSHEVVWDGTDADGRTVASGIYFYRFQAGDMTESRKMVLMK